MRAVIIGELEGLIVKISDRSVNYSRPSFEIYRYHYVFINDVKLFAMREGSAHRQGAAADTVTLGSFLLFGLRPPWDPRSPLRRIFIVGFR